jgi:DNA-binding transcriptional LysR family regulator
VLQAVRQQFPNLKLTLKEGYQADLELWLQRLEIDLAVTLLDGKPPVHTTARSLLKLPLVLMVPKDSPIKSAKDLWARDRIEEPLISLPTSESIYKNFQQGLARLKVDWFTSIEVSTVELVETYVAEGYGIGLSVAVPGIKHRSHIRRLALDQFDPVDFGVLWHGKPTPVMKACIDTIEQTARSLVVE